MLNDHRFFFFNFLLLLCDIFVVAVTNHLTRARATVAESVRDSHSILIGIGQL